MGVALDTRAGALFCTQQVGVSTLLFTMDSLSLTHNSVIHFTPAADVRDWVSALRLTFSLSFSIFSFSFEAAASGVGYPRSAGLRALLLASFSLPLVTHTGSRTGPHSHFALAYT